MTQIANLPADSLVNQYFAQFTAVSENLETNFLFRQRRKF
jgi:hypothetical protein